MKCSVVSLASLHAGHLALSTSPKRWRYSFNGEWPTLSWKIRLAIRLVILWSLVSVMNSFESGEIISGAHSLLYLSDVCHSAFQASFAILLCFCFRAETLVFSGLWRYFRILALLKLSPAATRLASASAFMLPAIPMCPAVHWIVSPCSFQMPTLCINPVLFQHLIIIRILAVQGFIVQKRGSTQAFYEDISDPTSIIKLSCMCLQTALGDLAVVSGCFAFALVPSFVFKDMAALCGL